MSLGGTGAVAGGHGVAQPLQQPHPRRLSNLCAPPVLQPWSDGQNSF